MLHIVLHNHAFVLTFCHRVVYALFCYTCFIIILYSSWHHFVFISLSYNACCTSFHLHAELHLFWVPTLPGWACALQFIKTAIRFTPLLVYLLIFYCRCTLPDPKLESLPCWVNESEILMCQIENHAFVITFDVSNLSYFSVWQMRVTLHLTHQKGFLWRTSAT